MKILKKCNMCSKQFSAFPSVVKKDCGKYCSRMCYGKSRIGRYVSEDTRNKLREANTGEKRYNWKGEKVGYHGLHIWVTRHLGRPLKCEHCRKIVTSSRKIHWANKSHEYKRDLTDWLRLCVPCHRQYDYVSIS